MSKFRIETLKDISRLIKELATGLRALTFTENFDSFVVDVSLTAGEEKAIRNQLKAQPTYVIVAGQTGNGVITKGDEAWNINYVTVKNQGAETVAAKLLFLR